MSLGAVLYVMVLVSLVLSILWKVQRLTFGREAIPAGGARLMVLRLIFHLVLLPPLVVMGLRGTGESDRAAALDVTEGVVVEGRYTSEALGWSMAVPDGWSVGAGPQKAGTGDLTLDLVVEHVGRDEGQPWTTHLALSGSEGGRFLVLSRPFVDGGILGGDWDGSLRALAQAQAKAHVRKGKVAKVNAEPKMVRVGGEEFDMYEATVLEDGWSARHVLFGRLSGGRCLVAAVSCDDDAEREGILAVWMASAFGGRGDGR